MYPHTASALAGHTAPMPAADRHHYDHAYRLRRAGLQRAIAAGSVRVAYAEAPHLYPGDLDDPDAMVLCWQCGQPLETCGPNLDGRHHTGRPAEWHAGHVVDGDPASPIVPECSPCNTRRGAAAGNANRRTRPPAPRRRRRRRRQLGVI